MQRSIWLTTALFTLLPAAAWADAQIVIHTEPADAQVILDGKPMTKADDKPLHVQGLAAGKHTVEVKKAGMVGELSEFELKDGATLPLNFKLVSEYAGNPVPKPESCEVCPEMVRIPGGKFMMGSDVKEGSSDENPRHEVKVLAFKLAKYEVTVREFNVFVNATGRQVTQKEWRRPFANVSYEQRDDHPVVKISFADAEAYIRWLNNIKKSDKAFRLPTEAEWEYAAKAGIDSTHYWAKESAACNHANIADIVMLKQLAWKKTEDILNCSDGYAFTAPVGSFEPNRFGLFDMLGNVWEMTCSDYTNKGYDGSELRCGQANLYVIRGGSWIQAEPRSTRRAEHEKQSPMDVIGFRLAQDL